MRRKTDDIFTTIRTEGALLPAEILRRIVEGDRKLEGLDPESYHLEKSEKINEAVNRAWFRCLGAWRTFRAAAEKLPDSDTGTTLTRERWLLILFQELGYGRLLAAKAQEIGGNTYPISHIWHHTPIHLVSFRQDMDRRTPGVAGAARLSPHSLVQEFLNRSENHLWGVVSNGHRLRILRDNISLTRQAYVDFDLEALMEGEIYPDFVLLYLLLHQSRLEADKPEECRLEKWSREAQERGTRALDRLRDGVEQAITALGQGFLAHPENTALRRTLQTGTLSPLGYYQQLLRLIYRFIFLFVAEDRGLIPLSDISADVRKRYAFYAIARLRRLAGRRRGTRHGDLYAGLRVTFACLEKGESSLGIPALNGFLFSPETLPDLNGCKLANDALLSAIRGLCYTEENRILRPVDYRNLGTEELGSVYESLLELHPELNTDAFTFSLKTFAGSERKTTGSYYTHPSLIRCLLDSALEPLLDEAMKKADPEEAILSLKFVDPACGSGHFLIAAAHRIAKRLAVVRTGEGEPPLEALREALRDVVAHCIYGVDINPLAVELCKVALWLESLDPRKPLGFLDHRIKCGNSIIGATPELLKEGIPDDAFKPVEGDEPAVASSIRRKNKEERKGQQDLFMIQEDRSDWREAASAYATWASLPEDNIKQVSEKARQYDTLLDGRAIRHQHDLADLWTAAFFWPLTKETYDTVPTQDVFRRLRDGAYAMAGKTAGRVKALADEHRFFHWHLEFPEVFMKRLGFDCALGNPPWERIKLQEKEFFAQRDPEIANVPNAAARKRLIAKLPETNPALWKAFISAKRMAEGESHFLRTCGRYPLSAVGDLNTYQIFAGLFRELLSGKGRAGVIVPTGIATDDTNKQFFADLTEKKALVSLYDFENREGIFPAVHRSYKFCLLTMGGPDAAPEGTDFAFFLTNTAHLHEPDRHFKLSAEDISLLNPNTRTCPVFRSKRDAALSFLIRSRIPVWKLVKNGGDISPWGVGVRRVIDMNLQGDLLHSTDEFHTGAQVDSFGNFIHGGKKYLRLFEGKMINLYNHRFADAYTVASGQRSGRADEVPTSDLTDVSRLSGCRYWVAEEGVSAILPNWNRKWLFTYMDVCSVTNERTVIGTIIPWSATSFSLRVIAETNAQPREVVCLLACFSSFCFDYYVRQFVGGLHLSDYIMYQMPVLPPQTYAEHCAWFDKKQNLSDWIFPRVLELTYTAWDMEPFAKDCGNDGPPFHWDEERRFNIRCELDALYFHLYGISRHDTDYILETFPIVKRKDIAQYGEYRTKNMILEIYDAMQHAKETGQPYQTILDPPPADPRVAHKT
ncbi:MAG: N-6 DNA methylase [Syntrophales bacterium]|nr:N-6 DNA methylase [Syntrophales bacterium]